MSKAQSSNTGLMKREERETTCLYGTDRLTNKVCPTTQNTRERVSSRNTSSFMEQWREQMSV